MDKAVKLDKVVHDDFLNFLPIDIGPVLSDKVQILHQDKDLKLELILVLNKWVLHYYIPLSRSIFNFLLFIFLAWIIYRQTRRIV